MKQLFIKENQKKKHRLTVRDERGQILYFIDGHWGRKDDSIKLYPLDSSFKLQAKQNKLSPLPTFELTSDNEKFGYIRKHPGLFGIRDSFFTVHPLQWIITGDFEELYFTAYFKNELIMECEKIQKNACEQFVLYVEEDNAPLCALITALLDHYVRGKQDSESYDINDEESYDFGFLNHIHQSTQYQTGNNIKVLNK